MLLGLIKLLYSHNRCFAIELLALQTSNIKLYQSRRYLVLLPNSGQCSLLYPLKISKNLCFSDVFLMFFSCFSDVSIGYKRGTITSTGLILVIYKAKTFYNPSVLKTIDSDTKPIYRRFGISNSVFSTLN